MLIKGYVEGVVETPSKFTDKSGRRKPSFWRLKVDNTMYGFGNEQPKCKEGDYVAFDAEKKGDYWNADVVTLKPLAPPDGKEPAAPTPNQAKPTTGAASSGGWKPNPEAETRVERHARQETISYQAARKDALEHVAMLLAAGLIDFGKAKGAQKLEIVDILVDSYTERYYNETHQLAPKEHTSPVEAVLPEGVEGLRKPVGRPKKPIQEPSEGILESEGDDYPWPMN